MQKKMCQNYFFLTFIAKKLRSGQHFFFWSGVSDLDISLNWLEAPKGGLPYERDGDARRKVGIKTLKDRSGRGSSLIILSPKGDRVKTANQNESYSDLNCSKEVYIEFCILLFDFRSIVIRLA